ncbi:MAG: TetR/AcrR family transcriptional regulator [Deltaproteobacteria bacterium]|nr:TetR/AcrR family transcriptional regulator [Deltaproteobacteria bacterium]
MIVYFRAMRTKDDEKKEALFEATVKLVNEIGFASSSVSKIAREANVSPATLYVYYKNKEDLLVSTYINIKLKMSAAILENFDPTLPIRDILRNVWFRMFDHISNNLKYHKFVEQFSNSPYSALVDKEAVEKYFDPLISVLQSGIEQKIIKDVNFDILAAFMWYPIAVLANSRLCKNFELNEDNIETSFTLAWDAIKL